MDTFVILLPKICPTMTGTECVSQKIPTNTNFAINFDFLSPQLLENVIYFSKWHLAAILEQAAPQYVGIEIDSTLLK